MLTNPVRRLAGIQRAFVLQWSEGLRDEVIRHCSANAGLPQASALISPAGTGRQVLLIALCLMIYGAALAVAVLGLYMLVAATLFWHYLAGLFCLLVAWFARPRSASEPELPLDPARYPAIHEVVRRVAEALQSPSMATVSVLPEFNASYFETAGGKRRHVVLGSLLMAALTVEQRIAVIAHEVSHGVNRDPMRVRWVHGAIETLTMWALSIRPLSIGRSADDLGRSPGASGYGPLISIALIPFELLQLALSELLFLVVKLIYLLAMKQSQQAEFFADLLATSAAGSEAMVAALERLHQYATVELVIQRAHLSSPDAPIEPLIRGAMQSMPESVAEDYRKRAQKELWQEDASHPPTASRIEVIRALPAQSAKVVVDEALRAAFDEEIAGLVESHKRSFFDQRLISLGY